MRGGEIEIFDGKTFSSLLGDIYSNSTEKRELLDKLISELSKQITTSTDVVNIAPIIQQYLDVSVKNDEQLVKMAQILQRIISAELSKEDLKNSDSDLLTDEEKEQLFRNAGHGLQRVADEIEKKLENIPKVKVVGSGS